MVRPYIILCQNSTISLETIVKILVNDAIVYTKNVVFDVNLGFRPENQRIAEEIIHLARRVLVSTRLMCRCVTSWTLWSCCWELAIVNTKEGYYIGGTKGSRLPVSTIIALFGQLLGFPEEKSGRVWIIRAKLYLKLLFKSVWHFNKLYEME